MGAVLAPAQNSTVHNLPPRRAREPPKATVTKSSIRETAFATSNGMNDRFVHAADLFIDSLIGMPSRRPPAGPGQPHVGPGRRLAVSGSVRRPL